jgi:DNA-binding NtrC family response regulator
MLDILLVDDEPSILLPFNEALRAEGYEVITASDGLSAMTLLTSRTFDVVICDVRLPRASGFEVLKKVRHASPATRCILMTAYAEVPDAVTALKDGAVDYLAKPFDLDELLSRLSGIDRERGLARELSLARLPAPGGELDELFIGRSPAVARLFDRVVKFAASDAPVLIEGESGTGKELVAHALHARSPRQKGPFIAVNCAAFPETLLEAELFGHEKGAFTGAIKKRDGRFKAADGGTLFLDEVAELSLTAQSKLLRVLQEGTYEPLGTNRTETANVRVLSATRDLKEKVSQRLFREDLYYRLKILELPVPALRERGGDLFLLIDRFLQRYSVGVDSPSMSARALSALAQYPFPGNVRELEHAIQHAVVLAAGGEVDLSCLPVEIVGQSGDGEAGPETTRTLPEAVRDFEREYLRRILLQAGGKRNYAAQLLGISRKNLWEKLRGYGLSDADLNPEPPPEVELVGARPAKTPKAS